MSKPISSIAGLAFSLVLAGPATAASDEMKAAIRGLDLQTVVDLIYAGEPIDHETFRIVLQVSGFKNAQQPRDVYWRHQLGQIAGYLLMEYEPEQATLDALNATLSTSDPVLKAQRSIADSFAFYIEAEGQVSGDDFRRDLEQGADSLQRPPFGDYEDLYSYLIYVAMTKQYGENVTSPEKSGMGNWRGFVNEVWDELVMHGTPPKAARFFLDAAMTPNTDEIIFTTDDGSAASQHIAEAVAHARASFDNGGIEGNVPAWDAAYTRYIREFPEE